jgi:hypothetical protein
MKHQVHVATESGIVSTEAVRQIRRLIADLAGTVDALDAARNHPRVDADDLDTRRRNLVVTIASLEGRLDCIEKLRSREYGAHGTAARAPSVVAPAQRSGSPPPAGPSIIDIGAKGRTRGDAPRRRCPPGRAGGDLADDGAPSTMATVHRIGGPKVP